MPNDCWGLIKFKGENVLEAWKAYFVYESLQDIDSVKCIHYKENHLEFKYNSCWKPNKELLIKVSEEFDVDIVYDFINF